MKLDVEQPADRPSAAIVRLGGRLDVLSAGFAYLRLRETIDGGRRHVVVDLTSVSFMDSSGLSALIRGLKHARQAGGDLRLVNPGQQARLVFQITGLDRVLQPYASFDEATSDL